MAGQARTFVSFVPCGCSRELERRNHRGRVAISSIYVLSRTTLVSNQMFFVDLSTNYDTVHRNFLPKRQYWWNNEERGTKFIKGVGIEDDASLWFIRTRKWNIIANLPPCTFYRGYFFCCPCNFYSENLLSIFITRIPVLVDSRCNFLFLMPLRYFLCCCKFFPGDVFVGFFYCCNSPF